MARAFPQDPEQSADRKVVAGLAKLGLALKSQAWQEAGGRGLTPTQGQILAMLRGASGGVRLSKVAEALGVKAATASEAVGSLVEKGLAIKAADATDGRALAITLTAKGRKEASRAMDWTDFLRVSVGALSEAEQAVFLRGVLKLIRELQSQGLISPSRLCLTCVHFRPFAHARGANPHHCALVDAPFGDGDLRLDCPEHHAAAPDVQAAAWERFQAGTAQA